MLRFTVGVARTDKALAVRRVEVAWEQPSVGATVELELARAKSELAETAREQRASRDVTADREGKGSEGRNPMGGCGAKQSHKARAG
jgi:hypothetical protein